MTPDASRRAAWCARGVAGLLALAWASCGARSTPVTHTDGARDDELRGSEVAIAGARLATGQIHACVIVGESVWCWGDNTYGQLGAPGDGAAPRAVPLPGAARSIAAAGTFTCACLEDGDVYCWGGLLHAQCPADRSAVSRVAGAHCASVEPGAYVVRTLDGGGQALVPHHRERAPAGDCEVTDVVSWTAAPLTGALPVRASGVLGTDYERSRGCWSSEARGSDATDLVCWTAEGENLRDRSEVRVGRVALVAVGAHDACAAVAGSSSSGEVWCWGVTPATAAEASAPWVPRRRDGALHPPVFEPRAIPGLHEVLQLSVGPHQACAIRADHALVCWGAAHATGDTIRTVAEGVEEVRAGDTTCWIRDREVWCVRPDDDASIPTRVLCLDAAGPASCPQRDGE